VLIKQLIF